jgi:CRISPR-associated protein Cas2
MYIVVCYDITDNSDRVRLHELLLGYGSPVQKSVFECDLTAAQLRSLRKRAKRYVRGVGDSIRYYQMCGQCCARTQADGMALVEVESEEDYVV